MATTEGSSETAARQRWLAVLARTPCERLESAFAGEPPGDAGWDRRRAAHAAVRVAQ